MPDVDSPFGYPAAPGSLPLTPGTSRELTRLADLYQSSLAWNHPAGPSPWTRERQESFRREADGGLETLRRELGDDWTAGDLRH